jgi:hypothetical protein
MRVRLVDVTDEGQWTRGTEPMAVKTRIAQPSVEERQARGKEARSRTPPSSHTGWAAADDCPDPVGLSEEQNAAREPDLVPVRHGRMLVSPFTFYRLFASPERERYAEQNELDYQAFVKAIRSGRLETFEGV